MIRSDELSPIIKKILIFVSVDFQYIDFLFVEIAHHHITSSAGDYPLKQQTI